MNNILDLLGRIFISSVFLVSAYNKIFNFESTADWMNGFGLPSFLLWPAILLEIIFPIFIIIGYKIKISAYLLALFCISTALIFHLDFSNQMQTIALLKNLGLAGGFLFIAVHGTGDWTIDKKKKYVRL
tara:strand:+ start:246 stop:632 length:387 start_codon:yes stop_codon:yes gene_type:complete